MNLSVNQWRIVQHDGNLLVTCVPGAGKTRIVEAKAIQEAARLIETPLRVACLTYTNAAAHELARRILPSLRDDARQSIFIGTIHSFCISEIISPYANYVAELAHGHRVATPEHPIAEAIIADIIGHEPTAEDLKHFSEVTRDVEGRAAAHNVLPQQQVELYWRRLLEVGLIDFSGVLHYAAALLERHPGIAAGISSCFSWFLIDEYQDTSSAQLRILRSLVAGQSPKWLLIGDFNQSIFGFNGVLRDDLTSFADYIGARSPVLVTTYRCCMTIAEQANRLVRRPAMRPSVREPQGEVLTLEGSVNRVIREFIGELRNRAIAVHSAAIIAPARWVLDAAITVLNDALDPIPWSPQFRFPGLTDVARCVANVLACSHHPEQIDHLNVASTNISALIFEATKYTVDREAIDCAILRCVDRFRVLPNYDFCGASRIVCDSLREIVTPFARDSFDRAVEIAMRPSILNNSPLLDWRAQTLARMSCTHDSITLATIHGSKGLEFDAVLLAGFEDRYIPHYGATDHDEEVRKAYVGVTRARKLLAYGFRRGYGSRFWAIANGRTALRA